MKVAGECGFEFDSYEGFKWLLETDDTGPLERFAAAMYAAGAESEGEVSDKLEKALKLCKFDSLNMRLDDMKFISAALAEVTAIRAAHTSGEPA